MRHQPAASTLRVTRAYTDSFGSQNTLRGVDLPSGLVLSASGKDRSAKRQQLPPRLGGAASGSEALEPCRAAGKGPPWCACIVPRGGPARIVRAVRTPIPKPLPVGHVGVCGLQHLPGWWSVAGAREGAPDFNGSGSKYRGHILAGATGECRGSFARSPPWAACNRGLGPSSACGCFDCLTT